MGNFLIVHSSSTYREEGDRLFRAGLRIAQKVRSQAPAGKVETPWVRAAWFARQNGSGSPILSDPKTGCWLLAHGTWFHADEYGSGEEARLLNRYLEVGASRLARELEGFFAIVVADPRKQQLFVLTDVMGSCHCFVRSWDNVVAIAGSSLLLAGLENFRLDPVGCQEYLQTGISYEDRTLYQDVRKLNPASVYRFSGGGVQEERRYWNVTDITPESLDGPAAADALGESLARAARKIGRVFRHPLCDLTGGYDSRALVAAFLTEGVGCSTFVSGSSDSPDVTVSTLLAQTLALPHRHMVPVQQVSFDEAKKALPLTDGEYDLVRYGQILRVHQTLMEQFDISINGSYGGIARGLWWELLFPGIGKRRALDARKLARLRYAGKRYDPSLFPREIRLDLAAHFAVVINRINVGLTDYPNTTQMDYVNLSMRIHRWQGRIASSTNQLWPCLSPFGLRSVLEVVLQTKARFRLRSQLVRHMLARYHPRLADFPLDRGYPASPLTWKNFHRFWPVFQYFGRRIYSKATRVAGGYGRRRAHDAGPVPPRRQLWRQEEVCELLEPATMRLNSLLDAKALGSFLARSRSERFPFDDQWTRLLSLEYTLRVLEEIGASPSA